MARTTNLNNKPPLGTYIGRLLRDMGRTQLWLAQESGLSKSHVSNIIRGESLPTLATLKQLAKPFGKDPFDLVGALFRQEPKQR